MSADVPYSPADDVLRPGGSGGTDNFQLRPAFWFGMAMCDNQSSPNPPWSGAAYPHVACTRDSDTNAFLDTIDPGHDCLLFPGLVTRPSSDQFRYQRTGAVQSGGASRAATRHVRAP